MVAIVMLSLSVLTFWSYIYYNEKQMLSMFEYCVSVCCHMNYMLESSLLSCV